MTTPEDQLTEKIADLFSHCFASALRTGRLGDLEYAPEHDEQDPDPWTVRDGQGRVFEIEWEVSVTEMTPEVRTRRKDIHEQLLALQQQIRDIDTRRHGGNR